MKKRKKKLILFAISAILILAMVGVFLKMQQNWKALSTKFQESTNDGTITYKDKKYRYNENLTNYLFLGIDTRESVVKYPIRGEAGQADAIYLLSYDRKNKEAQCLAIPRDTMAEIRVFGPDGSELGTNKDQINLQYAFGAGKRNSCELMKEAVSKLLHNVPIRGYCSLNMDGIAPATEAIGGVELMVPDNTLADLNPDFYQGNIVTITADTAEQFVRYRDIEKPQSAIARMARQKAFMEAFAEKTKILVKSDSKIMSDIYESVGDYMVTNMEIDLLLELAQVLDISETKIQDIPGKGVDGEEFDEYYIDEDMLQELILQIFYKEV